ncbi:hypothetical protein DKX38_022614 [Salix brachista]|uniref:AB hydrolase-1 domain-containing protein n=1 Tax=Salix brachista TaxID=2182728 RepID=A0A5N5K5P5_9ROSI|nr:hypothetical protein DKX38_022614 [Salix brachista]
MSVISNLMSCSGLREPAVNCIDKKILDFGLNWRAATCRTRISMPFEVKWGSVMGKSKPDPPTAVLLHGILGSRKNWGSNCDVLKLSYAVALIT